MNLSIPRLTISAPHRSSGKSTVTIGLCAALSARGLRVQPFKKGPDFIDPMWHEAATGRPSYNLDFFMMGPEKIKKSFQKRAKGADISIIEGNMGLYDGIDIEGSDSTAGLARLLKSPVILVIDCYGMTRGIAPLVNGFCKFEPETNVAGIILNKVKGSRHEKKLREAVERFCGVPVLGALPHQEEMGIKMRHLGLVPLKEEEGLLPVVTEMRKVITENVDLDKVIGIAYSAQPLEELTQEEVVVQEPAVRIGVAMDRAFTFYYPENLEALRAAGAELVPFSPLEDRDLPAVDALYIGGGFPEVHMEALEKNASMRKAVKDAAEGGMPVYAECGGLMYLCGSLVWEGLMCRMAEVFPCSIRMSKRPMGHGYVLLRPTAEGSWPVFAEEIRAHEFHHSSISKADGDIKFAFQVLRGRGVDGAHDGMVYKNVLAAYTHIHSLGTPGWATSFVRFVKSIKTY
jgi:cobyrinic acid a,c-diamide synthase